MAKISCLCVTRGHEEHLLQAVRCFLHQVYESKELIIVHQGLSDRLIRRLEECRKLGNITTVAASPRELLGTLRNLSIEYATGEYVCQWDDDDWYHPSRLGVSISPLLEPRGKHHQGTLTKRWLLYDKPNGEIYQSGRRQGGWEGSMLVQTKVAKAVKYMPMAQGEDTSYLQALRTRGCKFLMTDALMTYVYTYHGGNVWNEAHWKRLFAAGVKLPPEYRDSILERMKP